MATTSRGRSAAASSAALRAAASRLACSAARRLMAAREPLYARFCDSHVALSSTRSGATPSEGGVPSILCTAAAASSSRSNSTNAKPSASREAQRGRETHATAPQGAKSARSDSMLAPACRFSTGSLLLTLSSWSSSTSQSIWRSAATMVVMSLARALTRLNFASVASGTGPVPSSPVSLSRKRSRLRLLSEK
eukprot:scaffold163963_cov26-Tisochrysis_lutea.AAC.1